MAFLSPMLVRLVGIKQDRGKNSGVNFLKHITESPFFPPTSRGVHLMPLFVDLHHWRSATLEFRACAVALRSHASASEHLTSTHEVRGHVCLLLHIGFNLGGWER